MQHKIYPFKLRLDGSGWIRNVGNEFFECNF